MVAVTGRRVVGANGREEGKCWVRETVTKEGRELLRHSMGPDIHRTRVQG